MGYKMSEVEKRLAELGIEIPAVLTPVAAYVPYVNVQGLVFVSGALPMKAGKLVLTGRVGENVSLEEAQNAARQCAINAIASLKAASGNLDRIERIIKVEGYVASATSFTDQHIVMNAASELFLKAFGEAGKHARVAVGVASLPLGATVELAVVAKLKS